MRKFIGISFLAFAIFVQDGAVADVRSAPGIVKSDPQLNYKPCVDALAINCIGQVIAELPTGERINGAWTGKQIPMRDSSLIFEINFPGLRFENGTGKAVMGARYRAPLENQCFNEVGCFINEEMITMSLSPSFIDSNLPQRAVIDSDDRKIICPTNSDDCLKHPSWAFGMKVLFDISLRVTPLFTPVQVIGLAQDLDVNFNKVPNEKYSILNVRVAAIKSATPDFSLKDPRVIKRSIFDKDAISLFIYGEYNNKNTFGPCTWKTYKPLQVTSNAYWMYAPTWNAKTETLDFNLTSTHLDADGNLNKGRFYLKISEDFAACIYPISNIKQATVLISVLNADVATEVSTYQATLKNGFFELKYDGFHYSSPILKVKLTAPNVLTPEQKNTPPKVEIGSEIKAQPPISQVKKVILKSITCVKGVSVKKVTAIKPKCPSGYKQG